MVANVQSAFGPEATQQKVFGAVEDLIKVSFKDFAFLAVLCPEKRS